jgi:hypothetical protein
MFNRRLVAEIERHEDLADISTTTPKVCNGISLQDDIRALVKPMIAGVAAGVDRTGLTQRQERLFACGKKATPSGWWRVTFGEQKGRFLAGAEAKPAGQSLPSTMSCL